MPLSSVLGAQSLVRPGVCTSSTRPASPFEGQVIYETDTDKILVYNGSDWYAPWNTAWGVIVNNSTTTSDTTITAEEVQITGTSFTAVANRRYRISYYEPNPNSGSGYWTFRIRQTSISGTVLNEGFHNAGIDLSKIVVWIGTFSAGSTNVVATAQISSGTGRLDRGASRVAYLTVEDIGPA